MPVFAIFFLDSWSGLPPLAGVLALADVGLAAIGALVSSIAANSRARDLLVPLRPAAAARPGDDRGRRVRPSRCSPPAGRRYDGVGKWLAVLALYDMTFAAVGYAVYDFVLED